MKISNVLVSTCGILFFTQSALADDKSAFYLHMPLLEMYNSSESVKPKGESTTNRNKTATRTAFLDSAWLSANIDKVNLYVYPLADLKLIAPSYMLTDSFELGLDFGLNSLGETKPKNNSDQNLLGVFAFHYLTLKSKTVIESSVTIDTITQKGTETTTTDGVVSVSKPNTSVVFTKLMVSAVVPLKDNFSYVGSVWYDMTTTDDKLNKVKTTASGLGLNLASVRYAF